MHNYYNIFHLPPELLQTITLRTIFNLPPASDTDPVISSSLPSETNSSGARSCNICASTFNDVEEQRQHFRSDWHRYNVKSKLNGGEPLSELAFSTLVEGLEDSLSGSASSDSEDPSSDSDAVVVLMNKQKLRDTSTSPTPQAKLALPQTALVWFHSPPSTQIGIYRGVFPLELPKERYVSVLKSMQNLEHRTWAMFMVAGGHFAGAIVRVSRSAEENEHDSSTRKRLKVPRPDTEVLYHKTFHRYTTRRKQGGSQGLNDNAKGNAKSAGAMLRRYGEQALRDDIRNLLNDWADHIGECERIWIRASGTNRKIFMDYEGCVIQKGDSRLRTFPFPTRRPTQSELTRCVAELTRAKTSHFTQDDLREQDEAYLTSLLPKEKHKPQTSIPAPIPKKLVVPKLSPAEKLQGEKWTRLIDMITKGRLEPLKAFWERERDELGGIDIIVPEWTVENPATLLHIAAQAGQTDITRWLLEAQHANPTITIPARHEEPDLSLSKGGGFTAYDVCKTKEVRDVFRRCAAEHPELWDWLGAGHIPSILSKQQEDERDEKKKARRKGLKERLKEREGERQKEHKNDEIFSSEVVQDAAQTGSRKVGGVAGGSDSLIGLTPEMRMKVERERRARAAEARLGKDR